MKFSSLLLCLGLVLSFISCKTREDIAREKLVSNMNSQMQDSQKLNADFSVRVQNLEDRLSTITGQVEEESHNARQTLNTRLTDLESKLGVLEENQKNQDKLLTELQVKSDGQSAYIKEVLDNLKKLSGGKKKSSSKSKKRSSYDAAMYDYKKGRYKSAKQKLLTLLNGKKVSGSKKARVIHNLGMIAYMNKSNDKALAYFSRLFSEHSKSGYNKNGLLYLARTFKRMKKSDEAKQTLEELVSRFPKAKQVKEAKKMLKNL